MGLGILECPNVEQVPGTALLSQVALGSDSEDQAWAAPNVKRDPKSNIILVPQPSDDPNDPYNWSRMRKNLFTISYVFGCGVVGAAGPILGPAYVQLSESYHVSLTVWNVGMQGAPIACIGLGSLIWNALAVKYGKRPVYLFTSLGLMLTCFWAAASQSLVSLIVSRLFTGFCMAPLEALVPASIADIWCVHERGFRSALFNLSVLGGINLASVISGPIIQYAGFRAAFYALGAAFGLHLLMALFWMPETAFIRLSKEVPENQSTVQEIDFKPKEGGDGPPNGSQASVAPYGLAKRLRPYSGYKNTVPFWQTLLRPFILLLSPAVLWSSILFATCIAWLVGIAISLSQIFSAPPYNFSVPAVGATNASSFVASILGMLVAGPLVDFLSNALSRKNSGIYEPEFRLPIMVAYLVFTGSGFFAWGQSSFAKDPWPVPVVICLGLINFGIQLGATGVITYVVDCHSDQASEALGVVNFVKNMFSFGLVFYLNDWIAAKGVRSTFFAIGGITVACSMTAIPMYIFGKRARNWVSQRNIINN
ncbi:major facilitator superfamily domain-containing protein [Ilyonectria destructans]|nr:major facilitator superfamily domain-containing protein [Ilyonectria destructans]